MSATLIRKVNAGDTATGTATSTLTVDATGYAAGSALIIGVYNRTTASATLSSVTDSKGNTWTVDATSSSAANCISSASANLTTALVSGDTITLTWTGNVSGKAFHILNFSGLVTSALKDVSAASGGTGTTVAGPSVTTTQADDLLIGFYGTSSSITVSSTTWTSTGTQASIAGPTSIDSVYIEETSTGTYNPSVTYSGASASGRQATVAYKVAASGAPVNTVAPAVTSTSSYSSDQTLSCTTGTWTGDTSSGFAYQWKDASGNISGATSSTYRIAHSEVGASIHCTVTATGTGGSTAQDSNTVGPIYTKSPIILIYGS
jgi:hypothetical protein